MIDYQIYKIIHLTGLALLLMGLSGLLFAFAMSKEIPRKLRSMGFAIHGIGLFLILLGGFGMAARLGIVSGLPAWIYAKIGIWLLLGGAVALVKRRSQWAGKIVAGITVLVGTAAYLAIYKPF
jgi:hypothetical protein